MDAVIEYIHKQTGKPHSWIRLFIESWGFTEVTRMDTVELIVSLIKQGKTP
jgi:hypothetical protein